MDIMRDGTTKSLHTDVYQNLVGKNECDEEELGLNWIIGDFVSKGVEKVSGFLKKFIS
jgi:hypothetical protein